MLCRHTHQNSGLRLHVPKLRFENTRIKNRGGINPCCIPRDCTVYADASWKIYELWKNVLFLFLRKKCWRSFNASLFTDCIVSDPGILSNGTIYSLLSPWPSWLKPLFDNIKGDTTFPSAQNTYCAYQQALRQCFSTFFVPRPIIATRDRPIWLFWGRIRYIGDSWTDSRYQYTQNF